MAFLKRSFTELLDVTTKSNFFKMDHATENSMDATMKVDEGNNSFSFDNFYKNFTNAKESLNIKETQNLMDRSSFLSHKDILSTGCSVENESKDPCCKCMVF